MVSKEKNGVGFLVHQSIVRYIECFDPLSDRICKITLRLKERRIVLVQVYMPTSICSDEEVEQIYDKLGGIVKNTLKRNILFNIGRIFELN